MMPQTIGQRHDHATSPGCDVTAVAVMMPQTIGQRHDHATSPGCDVTGVAVMMPQTMTMTAIAMKT